MRFSPTISFYMMISAEFKGENKMNFNLTNDVILRLNVNCRLKYWILNVFFHFDVDMGWDVIADKKNHTRINSI